MALPPHQQAVNAKDLADKARVTEKSHRVTSAPDAPPHFGGRAAAGYVASKDKGLTMIAVVETGPEMQPTVRYQVGPSAAMTQDRSDELIEKLTELGWCIGSGMDCAFLAKTEDGESLVEKVYPIRDPYNQEGYNAKCYNEIFKLDMDRKFCHPNIVKYDQLVEVGDTLVVTMQKLKGKDMLDSVVARGRPFTEEEARPLFAQLLEGVKHLHDSGVYHCDLKPDNVFLQGQDVCGEHRVRWESVAPDPALGCLECGQVAGFQCPAERCSNRVCAECEKLQVKLIDFGVAYFAEAMKAERKSVSRPEKTETLTDLSNKIIASGDSNNPRDRVISKPEEQKPRLVKQLTPQEDRPKCAENHLLVCTESSGSDLCCRACEKPLAEGTEVLGCQPCQWYQCVGCRVSRQVTFRPHVERSSRFQELLAAAVEELCDIEQRLARCTEQQSGKVLQALQKLESKAEYAQYPLSACYFAPEHHRSYYRRNVRMIQEAPVRPSVKTDMWGLGYILWVLLTRLPLYFGSHDNDFRWHAEYDKRHPEFASLTDSAQNLIGRLLAHDPKDRPESVEQLLADPWVTNQLSDRK